MQLISEKEWKKRVWMEQECNKEKRVGQQKRDRERMC